MKNFNKKQTGISIIGILVLVVVVILMLSYFHISIRGIVESPTGQENTNYVVSTVDNLWNNYLAKPAAYLWNDVWLKDFWRPFISNIEKINNGQPTDIDNAANNLKVQQ